MPETLPDTLSSRSLAVEDLEMKHRAWLLAHKLICLARLVPRKENVDLLEVTTQHLCEAMGEPEGARLEAVQAFTREVAAFMAGYHVHVACGCGYLSLRVTDEATAQRFLEETTEPRSFRPRDLEAYFVEQVLLANKPVSSLAQTCDPAEIRGTLRQL